MILIPYILAPLYLVSGTVKWLRSNLDREEWLLVLGLTSVGIGIGAISGST